MKKVILLAFTLFSFFVQAQNTYKPGYIVKAQGDTVKGFILTAGIESLERSCSFKTTANSESVQYTPDQLKGFEITEIGRFQTLDLNPENAESQGYVFASVLVKGHSSLYAYKDNFYYVTAAQKTYKLEIVKKIITKNGQTFEQIQPAYKGILGSLMTDCENVKDKTSKVVLKEKHLAELVNNYNSCFQESKSEIITNKTLGYDLYAGLFIAASSYSYNYQNTSAIYIAFDQLLEKKSLILPSISFKAISKRSNVGLEINLLASFNNEFKSVLVGNNGFTYTTKFKFNSVQIPLSLSYNFKIGSFSSFIEAGANQILVYPDKSDANADLTVFNPSTNQTSILKGDHLVGKRGYIKPLMGVGASYRLNNKLSIIARARIEFNSSALNGHSDDTYGFIYFNHETTTNRSGLVIQKEYIRERVISGIFGITWKL